MKKYFTFFLLAILSPSIIQAQDPKLKITHLTGDFYIYTTYNTYKNSLFEANGMYLVTDQGVAIFDSPWDTTQFQPLLDSIKARHHKDAVLCIATHNHDDRTAALEYFKTKGIRTYTTTMTDSISKVKNEKRAQYLMTKDTTFQLGGYSFETYYGGPGHAPDNIVIWFEKEKILYGGCLIKSTDAGDLGNMNDANVPGWRKTLINVEAKCKEPKFVIPGHQSWKNKNSVKHTLSLVNEYLRKVKH